MDNGDGFADEEESSQDDEELSQDEEESSQDDDDSIHDLVFTSADPKTQPSSPSPITTFLTPPTTPAQSQKSSAVFITDATPISLGRFLANQKTIPLKVVKTLAELISEENLKNIYHDFLVKLYGDSEVITRKVPSSKDIIDHVHCCLCVAKLFVTETPTEENMNEFAKERGRILDLLFATDRYSSLSVNYLLILTVISPLSPMMLRSCFKNL
jgi:hypothetical protein